MRYIIIVLVGWVALVVICELLDTYAESLKAMLKSLPAFIKGTLDMLKTIIDLLDKMFHLGQDIIIGAYHGIGKTASLVYRACVRITAAVSGYRKNRTNEEIELFEKVCQIQQQLHESSQKWELQKTLGALKIRYGEKKVLQAWKDVERMNDE